MIGERELLALAISGSVERCVVCGDETEAIGVMIESDRTRLQGLCSVCSHLMKNARSPSFFLVRRGDESS